MKIEKCPYNLGIFYCGESIKLPFVANESGKYKMVCYWRGICWEIDSSIEFGKNIIFKNWVNENSTIEFFILKPNKQKLLLNLQNGSSIVAEYDKFSLQMKELFKTNENVESPELMGQDIGNKTILKTF